MAQSILVYCAALATLSDDRAAPGLLNLATGRVEHVLTQLQQGFSDQLWPQLTHLFDQPMVLLLAIGLGLALWLLGDGLLKPVVLLLGMLTAAALSVALVRTISHSPDIAASTRSTSTSVLVTWLALGMGAMLGLLLSKGIHRLIITLSTALTSAGIAGWLAAVVLTSSPMLSPRIGQQPLLPRPETMAQLRTGGTTSSTSKRPERPANRIISVAWSVPDASSSLSQAETLSDHPIGPASMLWNSMMRRWNDLPAASQRLIAVVAILGSCLGLGLGFFRPRHSAPITAALAGSLLWLSASAVLTSNIGLANTASWLHTTPPAYALGCWLLVAAVGCWFQRQRTIQTR